MASSSGGGTGRGVKRVRFKRPSGAVVSSPSRGISTSYRPPARGSRSLPNLSVKIPRIELPDLTDAVPQLNLFRNISRRIDNAASGRR